jgi:hypothetical protein
MRLHVHGTARAVSNGEQLDIECKSVVVRVVVQEWRRKRDGTGYEKSSEPIFLDLHTAMQRIATVMATVVTGDDLLFQGIAKAGFDKVSRPVVYIEVEEIAVVKKISRKAVRKKEEALSNLPQNTEDFARFVQADVTALPPVGVIE